MELKETVKETVGKAWAVARHLAGLGIMGSIPLYIFATPLIAFITLMVCAVAQLMITGRYYLITNLYRIYTITALRERLLDFSDHEFILRNIQKDQIWRGDTVDPIITKRLEEIDKNRDELHNKLMEMAKAFINPTEDKAAN